MNIYLIGSLRNASIPGIANQLRAQGHDVFDDWYAAGERADDAWRDYEKERGHSYTDALHGHAAQHVFNFDYKYLQAADAGILVLPAGRSGHLELGWLIGRGRIGYILLDNPERWDVMYQFARGGVFTDLDTLIERLSYERIPNHAWTAQSIPRGPVDTEERSYRSG